ncbi:UNVERIFIED_CONTAM: hypothetical protein Cloal_2538 [Acetivibrio alkalicellulosi]
MKFSVDHHKMKEMLLESICSIKDRISKIEYQFKAIEKDIIFDGKESLKVYSLVKKINSELNDVIKCLKECSEFVDYSITEYINMEKKIKKTLESLCSITIFSKKYGEQSEKGFNDNKFFRGASKLVLYEEPCRIPHKEFFTNDKVSLGEVLNGKNILVRSWKTS